MCLLTSVLLSISLFSPVYAEVNEPIIFEYNNAIYEFPDEETFNCYEMTFVKQKITF